MFVLPHQQPQKPLNPLGRARSSISTRWSLALAVAALATPLASSGVQAQTNGVWNSAENGNWNDATRWQGGNIPNGGGTALFGQSGGFRTVTLPSGFNPGVSTVTFNSSLVYSVVGAGSLTLAGVGGTRFDVLESATEAPALDTGFSHTLTARVTGTGPLIKTGPGTLTLSNFTNNYTGGTQIRGGMLQVVGPSGVLGAGSGTITLDGGTLRLFGDGGSTFITSRDTSVTSAGGRIDLRANATISNSFSGTGDLIISSSSPTTNLTVVRSNTLSGSLTIRNSTLTLGGAVSTLPGVLPDRFASLLNLSQLKVAGTLHLDNRAVPTNNKIANSTFLSSAGGEIILTGNDGVDVSEVLGNVLLSSGLSVVTVRAGASSQTSLTVNLFDRANSRGTVIIRGNGLGSAPDFGISSIRLSAAVPIGGGGAPGSSNQSILPFMVGTTDPNSLITGASLVARDAGNGALRPLNPDEFASSIGVANQNVRLTGATSLSTSATANSLTLADSGGLSGAGTLTLTSGAVVIGVPNADISARLNFPANVEGILHVLTTGQISAPISGTNGLTKSGPGTLTLAGSAAQSTYSGVTTLNSGTTRFFGNLPADGTTPSAFGRSTTAIVLSPGNNLLGGITTRLLANSDSVINRNINVSGEGSGTAVLGNFNGDEVVTVNGNVSLGHPLQLFFDAAIPATFNGIISGSSYLTDSDLVPSGQILNGNNTFAGGTLIRFGRYIAGSNTAFGTGPIYGIGVFSQAANATELGTIEALEFSGPKTFANPLVVTIGIAFEGTEDLTFTNSVDLAGNSGAFVAVNNARTTFAGPVRSGGLTKAGPGTLVLGNANNPFAGNLNITEGIVEVNAPQGATSNKVLDVNTILLAANTRLAVSPTTSLPQAPNVIITGGVSLGADAFFDLGDNDMIVRHTEQRFADPTLANLSAAVRQWYTADGGLPGTVGLGSSVSFYTPEGAFTTLAVFDNDPEDTGVPVFTTFDGVAVGPYDVLVKYTYLGDTDLSGSVDASDLARVLAGLNGQGTGWAFGDVNYDGVVDFTDLGRVQAALRGQGAPLDAGNLGGGNGGGVIPEPACLTLFAALPLVLSRRRRNLA